MGWRETMRRSRRTAVMLGGLALLHLLLGYAVLSAIDFGLGGKHAVSLQGLMLERRATYVALFALGGLLLLGAGAAVLVPGRRARLTAAVVVAMLYGGLAVHFVDKGAGRLADRPMVQSAADIYFNPPRTAYREAGAIRSLIGLPAPDALAGRREALIRYLWKAEALPATFPGRVADIPDPTHGSLAGLDRVREMEIPLAHGFVAVGHYFEPAAVTGAPVIYNHGHGESHLSPNALRVIGALLAEGRPVMAFSMPGHHPNRTPAVIETPRAGTVRMAFGHDSLRYLETDAFSPLTLFLEPLVVAVNWLESAPDGPRATAVDAVGFSGGGWTVTVDAAIDPRIRLSIPVAGSLPLYLLAAPPNLHLGDYEQVHPDLVARANFLELYVMGGAGEGRRQVQILNQFDGCCYRGVGARDYAPVVAEAVTRLGIGGSYELFLTDGPRHEVNASAIARIRDELARQPR